jgi:hypothetical protein
MTDAGGSPNGPSMSSAVVADGPVHVVDSKLTVGVVGVPAMAVTDTTGVGVARDGMAQADHAGAGGRIWIIRSPKACSRSFICTDDGGMSLARRSCVGFEI